MTTIPALREALAKAREGDTFAGQLAALVQDRERMVKTFMANPRALFQMLTQASEALAAWAAVDQAVEALAGPDAAGGWRPTRQQIARVIDPAAWRASDDRNDSRGHPVILEALDRKKLAPSLAKADAILAIAPPSAASPSPPGLDGVADALEAFSVAEDTWERTDKAVSRLEYALRAAITAYLEATHGR